LLWRYQILL